MQTVFINEKEENPVAPYVKFALGVTGAVLLGRLLPVVYANAVGAFRGATGKDPFEGLIAEHRKLLSLLDQMEAATVDQPLTRLRLFYDFKRTIGKHALAEEDIVYPLLQTDADRQEAMRKLYQEHASMKVSLFKLDGAIKEVGGWIDAVHSLRNEIEPHARQEEEVEFPQLRSILSQEKSAQLSRKIQQEESLLV